MTQWIQNNPETVSALGAAAVALLAASETLPFVKSSKYNGVLHWVLELLRKKFPADTHAK